MSPWFLQGILSISFCFFPLRTVCLFSRSRVGWVKCETFLTHHVGGECTGPWHQQVKGKSQICFSRLFTEPAHKFRERCFPWCFLEFSLGQTTKWVFYLFRQPGFITRNHLRQSEMSTSWSWCAKYHAWKAKYWQSTIQHNLEKQWWQIWGQ